MARKPPQGRTICQGCQQEVPAHNAPNGVCYGCHLDGYIPTWYPDAEKYAPAGFPCDHTNATEHPRTGVPILDDSVTHDWQSWIDGGGGLPRN